MKCCVVVKVKVFFLEFKIFEWCSIYEKHCMLNKINEMLKNIMKYAKLAVFIGVSYIVITLKFTNTICIVSYVCMDVHMFKLFFYSCN